MLDDLFTRIEAQRDALVELTRELVRFPTVNPPGEAYEPCARHLGNRLNRAGFEVTYVRAEGAIGDSERYPRVNVVARREGGGPARACTSTAISTWSRPLRAGPSTRSPAWSRAVACTAVAPAT